MKKSGFSNTKRLLDKITPEIEAKFATANKENADMVADLARVLIPEVSGSSRLNIRVIPAENGGQIIDFGKKAKVIEGNSGPRPFKNPAMNSTKKKRAARNRKAIRDAIKGLK